MFTHRLKIACKRRKNPDEAFKLHALSTVMLGQGLNALSRFPSKVQQ